MRDVAFSCDDCGAPFLRVAVWSLLKHVRGDEPLRINVLVGYGGHSDANRRALQSVVDAFHFASVRYVDVERAIAPYADVLMNRANSRWNIFTWTPVFVPELLPDVTGNVVHFDIDMLFHGDNSPLFDLDLGTDLIAAVAEYHRCDGKVERQIWGRGILPPEVERYFNTGTIVFNMQACRDEGTAAKLVAWYRANYAAADRIEQDAWNALYHRRTRLLPLKWNFHDRLVKSFAKWDLASRFWLGNPPCECLEAATDPVVLHFWGPKKPWKTCHRPYRRLYHEAMRAVGLVPPKEPLLAPWHNLVNSINLAHVRRRLSSLNHKTKETPR